MTTSIFGWMCKLFHSCTNIYMHTCRRNAQRDCTLSGLRSRGGLVATAPRAPLPPRGPPRPRPGRPRSPKLISSWVVMSLAGLRKWWSPEASSTEACRKKREHVCDIIELHDYSLKDRNLDSNTHVIPFLNDNDSPTSIKPLKKSYLNIQICVCAAADTESRYLPCLGKKQLHKQSLQLHSIISVLHSFILSQKYRDESLVQQSIVQIETFKRANPLLKATGASNNVCWLHCFATRWLLKKMYHWIIH